MSVAAKFKRLHASSRKAGGLQVWTRGHSGLGAWRWGVEGARGGSQDGGLGEGCICIETHDNSEADARLCNGRPKPANALGLVGEADAEQNIHSIRPYFGRRLRRMLPR